ncbi:MAG TPA: peptidylprolyl isomerase [Phycisphaerales bacterium]|nr:peptidylprolyl isomerase [Phycisphaerales bacterium]
MRKPFSTLTRSARRPAESFLFEQLERREVFDVTINDAISDVAQPLTSPITISLLGRYTDTAVTQFARLVTNFGNIDIALNSSVAPNTVANFLTYLNEGFYNNTIFHRSQRPTFGSNFGLIQGGGFRPPTEDWISTVGANDDETNIPSFIPTGTTPGTVHAPIALEHPTGNTIYSVGLARATAANSGTSQFYINTTDNTDVFDAAVNPPGFATFGTVLQLTRATVDAMNAITYYQAGGAFGSGALNSLPIAGLPNPLPASFTVEPEDYLTVTGSSIITDLTGVETVQWTASVITNPSLVSVSLSHNGELVITPNAAGNRGTATVRVAVTSADGTTTVNDDFTVEVGNFAPVIGGFQGQSNVAVGGSMLLSAYGVRDVDVGVGGVSKVEFWHDANGDGEFDAEVDTLLGSDDSANGGWNARIDTDGMIAGHNTIFAVVTDSDGAIAVSSRQITLETAVQGSGIDPDSTSTPGGVDVNLGFNSELPDTSGIRRITLFLDSNSDGILDPLNDRMLGHATYNTETASWGFTVDADDLSIGSNRIFARVTDNFGNLGGISSSMITVES